MLLKLIFNYNLRKFELRNKSEKIFNLFYDRIFTIISIHLLYFTIT